MQTYVALLYSIILGEGRRVVMSDLKVMAEGLGLKNPRTLVATGNLVFDTDETAIAALEPRLETAFERTFGRHVDIVVRDAAGWRMLAAGNPFPIESQAAGDQVAVRVMRAPVPAGSLQALGASLGPGERMQAVGGDIWIFFSRQTPNSRLLAAISHKRLGVGTSRNWNTVRRLADMVGA
ncbi:DUF1697 domain-containing protein [Mesorhizobium sp.]|uniref:DUF1697 domain-containing protein n=1 Tax=Mesorhizobium sp. TaxID=1871066 RepID=UPI003BAACE52